MLNFHLFLSNEAEQFENYLAQFKNNNTSIERIHYLKEFLRKGEKEFLNNGKGIRVGITVVGKSIIPIVINDGKIDDCYLVSPYVHYIAYLIEEVKKMKPVWLGYLMRAFLHSIGIISRASNFNRIVSINNWLFTTSLSSEPNQEEIRILREKLYELFPKHALVYRGLDIRDESLTKAFISNKFSLMIQRPFLEWDPEYFRKGMDKKKRQQVRYDMKLTENKPFTLRTCQSISVEDSIQMAEFYEKLYIEKHSSYNAHFTQEYFRTVLATGINAVNLLYLNNNLVGFVTFVNDNDRMIAALTGYNQKLSNKKISIYAAIVGTLFNRSLKSNKKLFLSTGVSEFKRRRGSYELMEYEAFFVEHLNFLSRFFWKLMKRFLEVLVGSMDVSKI